MRPTRLIPLLQQAAAQALADRYGLAIDPDTLVVQRTSRDHTGDYTLVLFPLMKHRLGSPEAIGQVLGQDLLDRLPHALARFDLVKGFLNLTLTPAAWGQWLEFCLAQPDEALCIDAGTGQQVMLEFPSPNTNKPLHLGHLRNIFLGDSLTRILAAGGFATVRANLYNDKGIHICKSLLAWQMEGCPTPEATGLKGDHLVGNHYVRFDQLLKAQIQQLKDQGLDEEQAKAQAPLQQEVQDLYRRWEAGDPAVVEPWRQLNAWVYAGFEVTFRNLGLPPFDVNYYESETYLRGREIIEEGLAHGVFFRKPDGSVWIDLTDEKLDEKLVLRSDGTSVYITQDLATAELKYQQFGIDRSIYVIGNEQDYHMKVLIATLKRLGKPYARGMHHLSYGMVELPTGRMKSREGTVVDADDLLAEMTATAAAATAELGKTDSLDPQSLDALHRSLGLGALKYFLLKVDPARRMVFNPEESIDFKGHTGTFIQYTHARSAALLRKAADQGLAPAAAPVPAELGGAELELVRQLYHWPDALAEAVRDYSPAVVANYVYDLARAYSRFYTEAPVLKAATEAERDFRLLLTALTRQHLAAALGLLGIEAPERM